MNAREAVSYLVGMGWSAAQAAGIVANLVAESGLNPAASGDGGRAYGIAQWHPDRQNNFAAVIGKSIRGSSVGDQLAFVHAELNGTEKAAGDALRACLSATDAGACVSERYERPADVQGEAKRRGAMAETILSQYGGTLAGEQPTAEPEAAPAPPVQGGSSMPLLLSLLPTILGLFAPRVQAAAQKITGQPPEVANQFVQSLFEQLQQLTGKADPIQATAAVQANPDPAVVQQLEDHTLDYLDKIAPMIDRIAKGEADAAARTVASQDAAAGRTDSATLRPALARNVWIAVAILSAGILSIIGLEVALRDSHQADNDLMVLLATMVTYMLARLGDVYGFAFGGVQQSQAGTIAVQAAQKALAK